jgi:serine/threonine protein kinase
MIFSSPTLWYFFRSFHSGRGSFGQVFKGMWHSNAVVAMKELQKKDAIKEFENEVAILKQLRHPHCVQVCFCC